MTATVSQATSCRQTWTALNWLLVTALATLLPHVARAEMRDISALVAEAGVDPETSTMVVVRLSDGRHWISNVGRATTRFIPASTSKIPHTLIALEIGVVDTDTIIEWDGKRRWLDSWNKDQTLPSAYRNSAVWAYQHFARQIGHQTMAAWITRFDYGNHDIGSDENLTTYWLRGPLEISASEQIDFLSKLAEQSLPLSNQTYAKALEIMMADNGADWTLYAKTGWHYDETGMDIGWYVGWVDRAGDRYAFALNMDMPSSDYVRLRVSTVRFVLDALDIAPAAGG
ncbi:penicillin-binding transpeptidase domain-containing protein [Litoreibacter roseus]|uniref:Penicillin-binding protein transpeptidase domain-containing protein n=1 Tax=Litoreibacter roseus TaxID=2601869 RepID=A0A6N6JLM4_9RHOB|nr:penicillin-binding transpeptidase domain-containing protein [Litoreibacter roseus]GFE66082.1 hypothetical protein KIN_31560 [Litoreibacter roseus]